MPRVQHQARSRAHTVKQAGHISKGPFVPRALARMNIKILDSSGPRAPPTLSTGVGLLHSLGQHELTAYFMETISRPISDTMWEHLQVRSAISRWRSNREDGEGTLHGLVWFLRFAWFCSAGGLRAHGGGRGAGGGGAVACQHPWAVFPCPT